MSHSYRRCDAYDPDQWSYRAKLAAGYIMRNLGCTRIFDTCFEMSDGDLIAFKIVRRAHHNQRLAEALDREKMICSWSKMYGVAYNESAPREERLNNLLEAMCGHPNVLADFSTHKLRPPDYRAIVERDRRRDEGYHKGNHA